MSGVSKCYLVYDRPEHRLLQGLWRGRKRFYREFWALHELSFEVFRGETVGIIGHNGSGKSTLLQIICGTLSPTHGDVTVGGRVAALLELGSGFNPEFTGRENVYLNGTILGLSRHQIDARFEQIAQFAEIGDFIDQPVKTYSSGMIVRLAFAVIAHVDADVLVIDEALAVGDALFTQKCLRFLRGFQERGTILFVSHDTGAVLNLCKRALWLSQGRLVQAGAAKDVVEAYMRANVEIAQRRAESSASSPPGRPAASSATAPDSVAAGTATSAGASPAGATSVSQSGAAAGAGDGVTGPATTAGSTPFGAGGARVESVSVIGAKGTPTTMVRGGERITLRVGITAVRAVSSAIVGFNFKDRLGQVLFGQNTCTATEQAPVALAAGAHAVAEFTFEMPQLRTGKYSIDIAVAEGTQHEHVQHQWFFDGAVLDVITDGIVIGLLTQPMDSVTLVADRP